MSDAFQELMGRMKTAVDRSKTARDHVKTASVEELEEPGDILANTIHGMNDDLEREVFPEEYAAKHAADEIEEEEEGANKEAVDYDDDGDQDNPEDVDPDLANLPNDKMKEKALARKKELNKGASLQKEAGFGRSVEEDLSNPIVYAGFNAELAEHEPVLKEAMAKILALR